MFRIWTKIRTSGPAVRVKYVYNKLFGKYLVVTNTVAYVSLYTLGDAGQQSFERYVQGKAHGPELEHDFSRSARFIKYACVLGPLNHFFYIGLDKFIVGGSIHAIVFKKLAMDQFFFAPFCITAFFMGMGMLEGKGFNAAKEELKQKFPTTYLIDWTVWPAAQLLNFYVIPSHLRLMYINTCTLFWNGFLSYMKHRDSVSIVEENSTEVAVAEQEL